MFNSLIDRKSAKNTDKASFNSIKMQSRNVKVTSHKIIRLLFRLD